MKASAIAPSNIAFIKFIGKSDELLRLPANSSLSMCLSGAYTTTTVEFSERYLLDDIQMQGIQLQDTEKERIVTHLNRLRTKAKSSLFAKVVTVNNFPKSSGIASSASGFAALTLAGIASLGLQLSEKELSILARQGSGSACRSIPDGFVEWEKGNSSDNSYAYSLYPPDYWGIYDLVAVVEFSQKPVTTTEGHKQFMTSPFYLSRLSQMDQKLVELKDSVRKKDFELFGSIVEAEALNMHAVMMTANPSLLYLQPASLSVMQAVWAWRSEGIPVFFTIDAGPNIHILCQEQIKQSVFEKMKMLPGVKQIIENIPSTGSRIIDTHLF